MRESEVPKRNGDAKNRLHLFFCGYSPGAFFITSIAHKARDISFTECEKFDTIGDISRERTKKFDTIGDISRERTTGDKTDGKEQKSDSGLYLYYCGKLFDFSGFFIFF